MRRQVNFQSVVKLVQSAHPAATITQRREMLAQLCRLIGRHLKGESLAEKPPHVIPAPLPHLAPRVKQTLRYLLEGDSEKQIARKLNISPHTVHVYVKRLYRDLGVSSRGELLSKFVGKVVTLDVATDSVTTATHARRLRRSNGGDATRATA